MKIAEKIVEYLETMPESAQAEVLDFVEYLQSKQAHEGRDDEWSRVSLETAMRGIEEEPSPYSVEDIKERF